MKTMRQADRIVNYISLISESSEDGELNFLSGNVSSALTLFSLALCWLQALNLKQHDKWSLTIPVTCIKE
jgi:hypothetical protein